MTTFEQRLRDSEKYVEKDKERLKSWGWHTIDWDVPASIVVDKKMKRNGELKRCDLIAFKDGKIIIWETTSRQNELYMPLRRIIEYHLVKDEHKIPLYISIYLKGEWLGYAEIDTIKIVDLKYHYGKTVAIIQANWEKGEL